jgi:PPOX class probable F420-dependent enzyme
MADTDRMNQDQDGGAVATLHDAIEIARRDQFLAVVSTLRPDDTIQSSVVNAGVLPHPLNGENVVGFVTYGRTKLANLRQRPQLTVTFRSGWEWVTVEGRAELIGPDDIHPHLDDDQVRLLLRQVFSAAGGSHDDWDAYDRAMAEQRRTAVFVTPSRIYSN